MKRDIADFLLRLVDEYEPWAEIEEYAAIEKCRNYLERFASPRLPLTSPLQPTED